MSDEQESVALTWETKEDMDAFYSPATKLPPSFSKERPFMEGAPERSNYSVAELAMQ